MEAHARSRPTSAAVALAEAARDAPARGRVLGALGALWGGHRDYVRGLALTRDPVFGSFFDIRVSG